MIIGLLVEIIIVLSRKRLNNHQTMVDLFTFENYREFLAAYLKQAVGERGESYRQVALKAGFRSSNYLQLIIEGKRSLKPSNAEPLAQALGLSPDETEYFEALVKLDKAEEGDKPAIRDVLAQKRTQHARIEREDESIFSHWLHQVIWEMTRINGLRLSGDLASVFRGQATTEEVERSIVFLLKRGFIEKTERDGVYLQKPLAFQSFNDRRRVELREIHKRFLDIAKHRLHDDLQEREFQSVTVAIPRDKLPLIKERIRTFINQLNDELSDHSNPDTVVNVTCTAFKVADFPDRTK